MPPKQSIVDKTVSKPKSILSNKLPKNTKIKTEKPDPKKVPMPIAERCGIVGAMDKANEIRLVIEHQHSSAPPQVASAPIEPVKTRKPRKPLTDEQRAAAIERVNKAREVRMANLKAKREAPPAAIAA